MTLLSRARRFLSRKVLSRKVLSRKVLSRKAFRAQRLEASGRLEEATAAYLHAGVEAEAARLLRVRAENELDAVRRYALFGQALSLADDDDLRRRRARLALELVHSGRLQLTPSELVGLGADLEKVGESMLAADAYSRAGDVEAQARALVSAGAVERLEQVLERDRAAQRRELDREAAETSIRDFVAVGRRRAALALLQAHAPGDDRLAAEHRMLLARRLLGPRVELEMDGVIQNIVFGERVILGRTDAGIAVASPCVSRAHLCLSAGPHGPEVADLASRNATTLAGAALGAPLVVDRELVLVLGGAVEVRVAPWGRRGVSVDVGGERHVAPLDRLEVGGWIIEQGTDLWIEVASETPFYLGDLQAERRVELCRGDELRSAPSAEPRLRVPA